MDIKTEHWTFDYFNPDGSAHYKPKKIFESEYEAQDFCFKINIKDHTIRKAVAYKCSVCGNWHIGHHVTVLTNSEKEKIRVQYEKWRLINGNKLVKK